MKRPNRHLRYRRRRRGHAPALTALLASGGTLLLLLLILLIVGNLLHQRNASLPQDDTDAPTDETAADAPHTAVREIRAPAVAVRTEEAGTFSDRLAALTARGYAEASVPLNTAEGDLLYASSLGTSLGFSAQSGAAATAEELAQAAKDANVYLSGIYYLTAFSQEDDLLRSVALSRSAALLAELFRAGWNDVLLLVPAFDAARADELLRFAEDLRALAPQSSLGLALTPEQYAADNAALIDRLYGGMDFLALDATGAAGEEDVLASLSQTVCDPNIRYHLLHYRVRILLPAASDRITESDLIAVPEGEKLTCWQFRS